MEILISIAGKISEYAVAPVARQVGYLIFYGRNVKNLKNQVEKLQMAKRRVEHKVHEATRDALEIETEVKDWLNKMDEMVAEAKVIYGDEDKGSCLHLWQRTKISRKASKMTQEMTETKTIGNFDRVGWRAAPQALRIESRTNIVNEILKTLLDSRIHTIGIWGLGGLGKTTLAKEVLRQAKEKKLFDHVVMITMTVNPSVERVQKEIADLLGLIIDGASVVSRAVSLKNRIKEEKSILVAVDDIWEDIELERFGIPWGGEHRGCKLLLTSRSLNVLEKMYTRKYFHLELLKLDEAESLFENMAGDIVKDRQAITSEIVKRCEGLPVLIVTVAKALRNKEEYAWKDALEKLKGFDKHGMHQEVYSAMEQSYSAMEQSYASLRNEKKLLFLLIALQGRCYLNKYDLLIFSVGLGIFKFFVTLKGARDCLHTLTKELKDRSLLIEDEKIWVSIPDVIRKAVVSIATQDQTFFSLKVYSELKKWPGRDRLQKCKQIFLPWCYMPPLPRKLESPELEVLALENAGSYMQMPDSFFEETRNLKVLDICGMDCTPKPPTSLGLLKNLTALYLYQCNLEDIAMVGELRELKILNLCKSNIQELPRNIGYLQKLRLLDIGDCHNLKVIPPEVISKLHSLEELYLGNGFVNWEVEVEGQKNASLDELEELKDRLTSIDLSVPDANVWPTNLFFDNLERFRIFIGDVSWDGVYESKRMKLKLNRNIYLEHGIKLMLKDVEDLLLDQLNGVKDVLHDLYVGGFHELKHLTIQNNGEIESVAASSGHPLMAFPNIETLSLYNISNLEHTCHGFLAPGSFCKLGVIKVQECHNLKYLFTSSMSKALPCFAEIEVINCNSLEVIFELQEPDDTISSSGKNIELKGLHLVQLPKLKRIWNNTDLQGILNLETLSLYNLSNLEHICHGFLAPESFCKLRVIKVQECHNFKCLFTSSMSKAIPRFAEIEVINCNSLEVIFELQEPDDTISSSGKNIELKSLHLVQLPKLKWIWNNTGLQGIFNFKFLKKVCVEGCPMFS